MLFTIMNGKKDQSNINPKTEAQTENKAQLLKIVENLKNKHNFDESVGELYHYIDKNRSN